jgi:methylenetetrahydrofolate dehydrogenase (NADP+)/methenyltetrahydrofolate cyclohydrolase
MKLLDGKKVAQHILSQLQKEIARFPTKPKLNVILIGNDPASISYVHQKAKACEQIGVIYEQINYSNKISEAGLFRKIHAINKDKSVNGLIVQLPLPKHIDTNKIIFEIDHHKDVDGFHPFNLGKIFVGLPSLAPCTPLGIIRLLEHYKINLTGKNIVVVGKSNIVGKPMAILLLNRKATVTSCDAYTKNLKEHTKKADIIISATGVPHLINASYIKKGAILIDVGFSFKNGKVYGDIDPKSIAKKASYLSPVPGGVGPMTVALLLENTVKAYKMQHGLLS